MKKIIILATVFVVVFGNANAQIELLHTFEGRVLPLELQSKSYRGIAYDGAVGDLKGFVSKDRNVIKIYNEDFSLQKTIKLPNSSEWIFVSKRIFNTDDKIEILGDRKLYDEDGNLIRDFGSNAYIYLTKNNEYRLILEKDNNELQTTVTEIYSLPGKINLTSTSIVKKTTDLAFNLRPGEVATMKIYNVKGQLIDTKQVDYVFNRILLNTTNYRKGIYVYEINGISKKFKVK